jgi:hypothetical protein
MAAVWLVTVPCLQAEAPSGEKLLDEMISHPGSYWQICDVITSPSDIPYRAFELSDFSGRSLSKGNEVRMGHNRDVLVEALRNRLLAIDFSKVPQNPGEDPKPEENFDGEAFGCDPTSLNPILLEVVRKLKAIEALPELLALEDKLVVEIGKAKDDVKIVPPHVAGWSVGDEGTMNEEVPEAKRERRHALFQARIAQRDLVVMIAWLMREKNYQPYLKTSFESAFAKGLKVKAKEFRLPTLKPGQPAPQDVEGLEVVMDPVTRILYPSNCPVMIPYSRESRDEIRAAAAKWIQENP